MNKDLRDFKVGFLAVVITFFFIYIMGALLGATFG
jgi:hypothetical protein